MKTIEELEAELETVTRERDLSLFAWESAGMQGRTAQSAMLELARQLEEARAIVGSCWLTYSEGERDKARAWAHKCERERDELVAQRARMAEQIETLNRNAETFFEDAGRMRRERDKARASLAVAAEIPEMWREDIKSLNECLKRVGCECDAARAEVERLTRESAMLNAMLDGRMPDTWREDIETLTHQLADATNESTHFQVMCKREGEEIERLARQVELLTDERDELLVRVAEQDAELRATREAYNGARTELTRERIGIRPIDEVRSDAYRRGAEAMRDECIGAACEFFMGTTGFCNGDEDELEAVLEALPIPEEP